MRIISKAIEDNEGIYLEITVKEDGISLCIEEASHEFNITSEKELEEFVDLLRDTFEDHKFYSNNL